MTDDVSATAGPPREVRTTGALTTGEAAYGAVSRGSYGLAIEEMWELFADPEKMRLWNPDTITGDFELGGRFQVKNNASGTVLQCEAPNKFRVSWEYMGTYSELEVRLAAISDTDTVVEIDHLMATSAFTAAAPITLGGALAAAGSGWDFAIDYLHKYLNGDLAEPPTAHGDWVPSDADNTFYAQSEQRWKDVTKDLS